jgi:hypothetical protein
MKKIAQMSMLSCMLFVVFQSCQRGRPARKTLPDAQSSFGDEGMDPTSSRYLKPQSNYLFYSSDTSLLVQGKRENLLVLSIPDPAKDSTVLATVKSGQGLASFLIAQLRRENRAGVIIDLRSFDAPSTQTFRQDYLVKGDVTNSEDLPVIFVWDRPSEVRASDYLQLLGGFPGISLLLSNDQPVYQQDCFEKKPVRF